MGKIRVLITLQAAWVLKDRGVKDRGAQRSKDHGVRSLTLTDEWDAASKYFLRPGVAR